MCKDVLGVMFDFLDFSQLCSCMRVCQEWLAAAYSMHGLSSGKLVFKAVNRAALFSSRLSRHVSSLAHSCTSLWCHPQLQLMRVVAACPFLRELDLLVRWAHLGSNTTTNRRWAAELRSVVLPNTLREMTLQFSQHDSVAAAVVNAFLCLLGGHAPLSDLQLTFDTRLPEGVSFAPLQQAAKLRWLCIEQQGQEGEQALPLTASQIAELRQLHLTTLELMLHTSEELLGFLQLPGPPLQWCMLPNDDAVVTDVVAALLPTLPNLHTLFASSFQWEHISSFAFLPQMAQLRTLHVNLSDYDLDEETQQRIAAALAALTRPLRSLTAFRLSEVELSQPQLRALLALMPQLQRLTLMLIKSLCDFTPLLTAKATLRSLELSMCDHEDFHPNKLMQLQHFEQLQELCLVYCFNQPLDRRSLAMLQPPSQLLPKLQKFDYEPWV